MVLTLVQAQSKADAFIAARLPTLKAKQDAYFAANGRYWQGLWTNTVIPVDGEDTVPDRLDDKPYYQVESWRSFFGNISSVPVSISVDAYDGPYGKGYIVTITGILRNNRWARSINVGPETWRSTDWTRAEQV